MWSKKYDNVVFKENENASTLDVALKAVYPEHTHTNSSWVTGQEPFVEVFFDSEPPDLTDCDTEVTNRTEAP